MSFIPSESFSGILSAAMDASEIGPVNFSAILADKDPTYSIDVRRIREYINGSHTPPFDKAKFMLQTLDYDISDEDLRKALQINKMLVKERSEYKPFSDKEILCSVRIKFKNIFGKDYTDGKLLPEEAERKFWDRVNSLSDGTNSLSKYIQALVTKDIREYLIDKEDVDLIGRRTLEEEND